MMIRLNKHQASRYEVPESIAFNIDENYDNLNDEVIVTYVYLFWILQLLGLVSNEELGYHRLSLPSSIANQAWKAKSFFITICRIEPHSPFCDMTIPHVIISKMNQIVSFRLRKV